jgi:hypothetical protein
MKIKLELDGRTYLLQSTSYSFYPPPPTNPGDDYYQQQVTANLNFTLKPNRVDQFLMDWLMSPKVTLKDGKVSMLEDDTENILKQVTFQKAYPTGLSEAMDMYYDNNQNFNFSVNAEKISIKLFSNTASPEKRNPGPNI